MKYCTACGAELPDNAKFCTKCGAQVSQSITPGATPTKKKNLIIAIVAVIVIIIAAFAIKGGGKAYEKPIFTMVDAINDRDMNKLFKAFPISKTMRDLASASVSENWTNQTFNMVGDRHIELEITEAEHMSNDQINTLASTTLAKECGATEGIKDGYFVTCKFNYDNGNYQNFRVKVGKWKGNWYVFDVN